MSIPGFDAAQDRFDNDDGPGETLELRHDFQCQCHCWASEHTERDDGTVYCGGCDACDELIEWEP